MTREQTAEAQDENGKEDASFMVSYRSLGFLPSLFLPGFPRLLICFIKYLTQI